ncbi:phosphoadenosine phosphosulfate reductase, partial [Acinetobacter baumannii]
AIRALKHTHATGNPFLDLCIWKGRFPSTKARFCSTELKREVILYKLQFPLIDQGYKIISWQGVRADESPDRAKLPISDNIGDG